MGPPETQKKYFKESWVSVSHIEVLPNISPIIVNFNILTASLHSYSQRFNFTYWYSLFITFYWNLQCIHLWTTSLTAEDWEKQFYKVQYFSRLWIDSGIYTKVSFIEITRAELQFKNATLLLKKSGLLYLGSVAFLTSYQPITTCALSFNPRQYYYFPHGSFLKCTVQEDQSWTRAPTY